MKEWFDNLRYKLAYAIYPEYFDDLEERLSGLLCHVTGGLLSKTNYTLQGMITAVDDYQQRCCDECEYYLARREEDRQGVKVNANGKYFRYERIYSVARDGLGHLDDVLRLAKQQMFGTVLELVPEGDFCCRFCVCELSPEEVFMETEKCKRADGKYVVAGDFYTRQEVEKIVKENGRAIVLQGQIIEDEKGGVE